MKIKIWNVNKYVDPLKREEVNEFFCEKNF